MLIRRSPLIPICVFFLFGRCDSQNYDGDYDGPSHYSEDGGDQPDYTPYFNGAQQSSGPLLAGNLQSEGEGFVQPLDFGGFFVSPNFGFGAASTPAQQKKPTGFVNPNEFQVPLQPGGFQHTIQHPISSAQNFENFFVPSPSTPTKSSKVQKSHRTESSEVDDLTEEGDDDEDYSGPSKPKLNYKPSKYADKQSYNSLAKKLPYTTGNKLKNQSPYEKYSFQPVGNLKSASFENIRSTSAPYRADATSPKAQKQKGNCRKVNKQLSKEDYTHGRFRRGAEKMNCYVCEDPKSGGSYEQCSYSSPDNSDDYFVGHASKYSTQGYPDSYRNKRSPKNKNRRNQKESQEEKDEEEYKYSNPYDEEKSASHSYNSQPEEFGSEYYKSPDFAEFKEDYRFGPEYFTDSTNEEKSFSEQQAEELKKSPENCQKVKKDGLTCMVCKNPKTGGNYEQCSYSSEPEEKRYAYVKEKKYNSNDEPENADEEEETQQKPVQVQQKRRQPPKKVVENYNYQPQKRRPRPNYEESSSYNAPQRRNYQESRSYQVPQKRKQENGKKKLNYEALGSYEVFHPSSSNKKEKNPQDSEEAEKSSYEVSQEESKDYVSKLFPDYAEKESQIQEAKQRPGFEYSSDLPEYFTAEESKKDVDSVLAEFAKKDRSNCKKIAKNQMTCFVCTDEKGVNHEECMFVSESSPKKSHLAYHEVKEFSTDPQGSGSEALKVITTQEPYSSTVKTGRSETYEAVPTQETLPAASNLRRSHQGRNYGKVPTTQETPKTLPTQRRNRLITKENNGRSILVKVTSTPETYPKSTETGHSSKLDDKVFSTKVPIRIPRRNTNLNKELLDEVRQKRQVNDEEGDDQKEEDGSTGNNGKVKEDSFDEKVQEIEIDNSDGAYASELVPVFSKKFGTTLPKFMVDVSEHEKLFDEVVTSGQ